MIKKLDNNFEEKVVDKQTYSDSKDNNVLVDFYNRLSKGLRKDNEIIDRFTRKFKEANYIKVFC